ncbi:MAG: hypothetical protein EGQ23_08740 [Solobacterium sp.]|nr:hypothetical protein [Solobacterium sp.]
MNIYQGNTPVACNYNIISGALIDDSSINSDKVWSSEKVSNSTVPYILIDTTKDIDFDEYTETGYYTPNKSFSTGWFTHSILHAPTEGWLPAGGFALEIKTFDNTSTSKGAPDSISMTPA